MLARLDNVSFYQPGSRSNAGVDRPPSRWSGNPRIWSPAPPLHPGAGWRPGAACRSLLRPRHADCQTDAHTPTPSPRLRPAPPRPKRASHRLRQCRVDHRKVIVPANDLDVGHPQHALQLAGGNRHGARPWRSSWCRLRECGRHRRMKADVALNLLYYLMNVAVQDRDRPKPLDSSVRSPHPACPSPTSHRPSKANVSRTAQLASKH